MATSRPFAYNTGTTLPYTDQVGDIAIGTGGVEYAGNYGGLQWWGGPDEDLGYVIAHTVPAGNQPNPLNIPAFMGFWRSPLKTEQSFVDYTNFIFGTSFTNGNQCKTYLNNNGYWTSYNNPLLIDLDTGNPSSYSGTGVTWYDLSGYQNDATLINNPTYLPNYSGILNFNNNSLQYGTVSDIGSLSNWSIEVWFRLTTSLSNKISSIISNQFNGSNLNFSIGTNNAPFSSNLAVGFYDGAWRTTSGFVAQTNTWYQVVGTYDGSVIKQYINGVSSGGTLNYVGSPQSGGQIRLMARWDDISTSPNYIDGDLAIVKVYNSVLDSSQILQNYINTYPRFIDPTPTPTPTLTVTPTNTVTPSLTQTPTNTITPTPSNTTTITPTPTNTPTVTVTPSSTPAPSSAVTFSQTFTSGLSPGVTIENAWTLFRSQLTGTYTKFDFTSSNGQGYTGVTDAVKVQQLADALRTGTTGVNLAVTINSVVWNVGCCACRSGGAINGAVEFANVSLCSGSSTAALRPFINNNNWGGIGSTVGAATQTLTLKFY